MTRFKLERHLALVGCCFAIAAAQAAPMSRCDALAGDAKAGCIASAKARHGKAGKAPEPA
jgi:hypothetical protein